MRHPSGPPTPPLLPFRLAIVVPNGRTPPNRDLCGCCEIKRLSTLQNLLEQRRVAIVPARMSTPAFEELLRLPAKDKEVLVWGFDTHPMSTRLTCGALDTRSDDLARALLARKLAKHGDRILLAFPPGPDFVVARFACWRAGLIAGTSARGFYFLFFYLLRIVVSRMLFACFPHPLAC